VKNRILLISLVVLLALSVGLVSCGGEEVPEIAEYSLTISSTGGGLVTTPGEGTGSFTCDEGEVVDLVATADEGYHFVRWTGDVDTIADVNDATTTITMNGDYIIIANFEQTASITFAVVGPMTDLIGQNHWDGASMAADEINSAGGMAINGMQYAVELVKVETKEATEGENGGTGTTNLQAAIDDVDFVVGGFRTEIVWVYREVAMDAKKIFMNCGAATEALQFSVVTDYDKYKYWFKVTPVNGSFLVNGLLKITRAIGTTLSNALASYGGAIAEDYRVPEDGNLRVAILAENASWCTGLVLAAQTYIPQVLGYSVVGTWLVSPTATSITAELSQIAAMKPHIIFTAFWERVGVLYSEQRIELGMPAMTIGINVGGELRNHWADTGGKCNGEIMLDSWAEGLESTAKTTAFSNAFMARTGECPIYTAGTYNAIYSLKEAIEAVSAAHGWDDIEDVVDPANIDALIQYLETSSYTGTDGRTTYYPRPAVDLGDGAYALSEEQVRALYPNLSTYNQNAWRCAASGGAHIAHDIVYGPGYVTGIGSQWQDGHKVGVWPTDLGDEHDAGLTDQYGCWNFEYPGTVDVVIPIEGFLA
jgi:branched-chain amino acid transport system substrate-binding protein